MIHIKEFIISQEEPTDTTVGWLKPIEDGKYSIYFYGSKGWCSVVDETSGGGSGGGIENIETEATSPLNLEATISGTLATITGSVDVATGTSYGVMMCSTYHLSTAWNSSAQKFSVQSFNDEWGYSAKDSSPNGDDNPELFYQVYQCNDDTAMYNGLMVGLPYPAPANIVTTNNINNVEYVMGITSEGYLRRVPVSLFTQE